VAVAELILAAHPLLQFQAVLVVQALLLSKNLMQDIEYQEYGI
jgi:hypothetical protein